jgi:glutathione S-transferase
MPYIEIVAIIALLQFMVFGILVGKARQDFGVKAPAVTGHESFERIYRVHMNTLECLITFLPALFLAARYWPAYVVAGLGVVYLIGRMVYWRSYVAKPENRGFGFMLSFAPTVLLMLLALAGIVRVMLA